MGGDALCPHRKGSSTDEHEWERRCHHPSQESLHFSESPYCRQGFRPSDPCPAAAQGSVKMLKWASDRVAAHGLRVTGALDAGRSILPGCEPPSLPRIFFPLASVHYLPLQPGSFCSLGGWKGQGLYHLQDIQARVKVSTWFCLKAF